MVKSGRAGINFENALSWIQATFRGRVSPEESKTRRAICAACPHRAQDEEGYWCAAPNGCGCGIQGRVFRAWFEIRSLDITLYKEEPYHPLCHHPQRFAGEGWPNMPKDDAQ